MSIKQNGGVFGRNPTFNDVTIEGQLTFDGDIDINSDLKIDGDLEVTGDATVKDLYITDTTPTLRFTDTDGNNLANLTQSGTHFYFDNDSTGNIRMRVDGNTERFTVNHTGVDVNGDFTMTDTLPRLKMIDSDGTNQELYFEESGGIGSMTVRNGSNNGTLRLRANNGSTTTNTLEIDTSGNVKVLAGNLVISTTSTPASATASGTTGTIAWDSSYVYVCTATNTWKRTAISTW
tara:strand:- start:47 stop:748 length:702 start_codon:yes stop_codon:yes gene_type:complete